MQWIIYYSQEEDVMYVKRKPSLPPLFRFFHMPV